MRANQFRKHPEKKNYNKKDKLSTYRGGTLTAALFKTCININSLSLSFKLVKNELFRISKFILTLWAPNSY